MIFFLFSFILYRRNTPSQVTKLFKIFLFFYQILIFFILLLFYFFLANANSLSVIYKPKWVCPGCTFRNEDKSIVCDQCGHRRAVAVTTTSKNTATTNAAVASHTPESSHWTCSVCTFADNKSSFLRCAVCDTTRTIPSSSQSLSLWTCATCTFAENQASSTRCIMCNTAKNISITTTK